MTLASILALQFAIGGDACLAGVEIHDTLPVDASTGIEALEFQILESVRCLARYSEDMEHDILWGWNPLQAWIQGCIARTLKMRFSDTSGTGLLNATGRSSARPAKRTLLKRIFRTGG